MQQTEKPNNKQTEKQIKDLQNHGLELHYSDYLWTLVQALKVHVFFLGIMSGLRLLAYVLYRPSRSFPMSDLLASLFLGMRFDNSVLCYLWVIPVLLWSFGAWHEPTKARVNQVAMILFSFLILLMLSILFVDLKYYSYFQDHLNIIAFGFIEDDTHALIQTFWKNYPVVTYFLGFALFYYLCFRLIRYFLQKTNDRSIRLPLWTIPISIFSAFSLVSVGARGGFGLFPLTVADTAISTEPFLNYLSFNGVHSLYRAVKIRMRQQVSWDENAKYYGFQSADQAFLEFLEFSPDAQLKRLKSSSPEKLLQEPLRAINHRTARNNWAVKTQPHVVIVVMESFGGYWIGLNSQTFNVLGEFEKHWQADQRIEHFFPAMNATIGSISSLMVNAPQRPLSPFLTESQFLGVEFSSAPARVFAKSGYETRYVYGGNTGWRDLDKFARRQGFQSVEGQADISTKLKGLRETHDWGVYDEDVFKYVEDTLLHAKKPQLIVVLTTTNHPPYQVPANYQNLPIEPPPELHRKVVIEENLLRPRFLAYQYSSDCLGRFITQIKQSALSEKTILAATGDHGFLITNFENEEIHHKWSVPFYLYVPPAGRPKKTLARFGSHQDIFPTLMGLALSETTYYGFGSDLFDHQLPHYALHNSGWIIGAAGAVLLDQPGRELFYSWKNDHELEATLNPPEDLKKTQVYYRSLMGSVDYFFHHEAKVKK